MKINAFNVTTTHELMASRLRNQSMEEAAKATTQHASVQKAETQKQPTTAQKKSESASTASAKDGVFIQDINGKLWKTEDWDGSVKPNAIAVITPQHKFRIALVGRILCMAFDNKDTWLNTLACVTDEKTALSDCNGAANTKLIVEKCNSSTEYAAGWCNAYIFPDGVTKGYLPALGELNLAYQNKVAIDVALAKCDGKPMGRICYHWSSTFYGAQGRLRNGWRLAWRSGSVNNYELNSDVHVRPFAPLEI